MSWFSGFLTSSIGRKFVMAATGLFLISFLTIHCILNSLIFFNDHGLMFNTYAHFMGTNYIVHILEVGLFLGIILHIVQAYMLYAYNKQARPIGYEVNRPSANSKLYSRSMTLLGTLILIFLIIHLKDFWWISRWVGLDEDVNGKGDLFKLMINEFQNPFVVIFYLGGVFSLAWHLLHGFSSAFQTFGLNHKKYTPLIKTAGTTFSIIVPLVFALMPVSIYLGWIK